MKINASIKKQTFAMLLFEQVTVFIQMLMRHYNIDERTAIAEYYHSETYKLLSNEKTKLWHLSVNAVFEVYKTEKETGSALNSVYVLPRYA